MNRVGKLSSTTRHRARRVGPDAIRSGETVGFAVAETAKPFLWQQGPQAVAVATCAQDGPDPARQPQRHTAEYYPGNRERKRRSREDALIGVIAVLDLDLQIVLRQQDSAANCPTVENCPILGAAHSLSASFPRSLVYGLNNARSLRGCKPHARDCECRSCNNQGCKPLAEESGAD